MRTGLLAVVAATMLTAGCASGRDMRAAEVEFRSLDVSAVARSPLAPAGEARQLVRTAQLHVEVPVVGDALGAARAVTEAAGGHVVWNSASESSAMLVLRVPAARLDGVVSELGTLGRVTHHEEAVRDVTEQVIDLDARLRNLQAVRDRLHAYLERAQSVSDVIEVERELVRVQGEIDSLEGRLNHLRSSVEMAELQLRLRRQRVLGPLGAVLAGTGWLIGKLFVIR
jgi:hypothetical protein